MQLYAVVLLILALAPRCTIAATIETQISQPFYAVRSCLPYTLLLSPPSGANITDGLITFTAEDAVIDATQVLIQDGVMVLYITNGFTTNHTVNLTVFAPNYNNLTFVLNSGAGDVVLSPGFDTQNIFLAATSIGGLYAYGVTAEHTRVVSSGTNVISIDGSFEDVEVSVSGLAKVYVRGLNPVNGTVEVTASGISTIWVEGGPSTQITGTSQGLSKVLYTAGTCNVTPQQQLLGGFSIFGPACQATSSITVGAPAAFAPAFSCGIQVSGKSYCAPNDGTADIYVVPLNSNTSFTTSNDTSFTTSNDTSFTSGNDTSFTTSNDTSFTYGNDTNFTSGNDTGQSDVYNSTGLNSTTPSDATANPNVTSQEGPSDTSASSSASSTKGTGYTYTYSSDAWVPNQPGDQASAMAVISTTCLDQAADLLIPGL